MPLERGTKLGPYQIESPIGAGGMGEVYKATDTRLERTVAIKVLPAHVASDPERKQRFEREAKTISSLNHPNICTLHDVGREGETDFLVMEYLEGETLADRLLKGALPLDQALRYAIEIADALDKAHRQGVTHRDLKPANIMLTKAGAKLLDFGLAKLKPTGPQSDASTRLADALTEQGTILGTFQYMAPEQLEGVEADARTDIWAFGCVVYEMVTGQKAFEGKTQASLIGAIMNSEPQSIASRQPMSPPGLEHVVARCIAKAPDERWQTARDLQQELIWIGGDGSGVSGVESLSAVPLRGTRVPLKWALVGGLVVATLTWFGARESFSPNRSESLHVSLTLPDEVQLTYGLSGMVSGGVRALAVSPTGRHVAYVGVRDGRRQLLLRDLESFDSVPLEGTEDAARPFFSPDGTWIGFASLGKLRKVSISGGPPIVLCDAPDPYGASWSDQDYIVFAPIDSSGLLGVSAEGGVPEVVTRLDLERGERAHRWPQVLPGGDTILFTISEGTTSRIARLTLSSGRIDPVLDGASDARVTSSGHLVFSRGPTLMAVPFDSSRAEVVGTPVPVIQGLRGGQFGFSQHGLLVYVPQAVPQSDRAMVWVDRRGQATPIPAPARNYGSPKLSPDGTRIAVPAEGDIWMYELGRETLTRLTLTGDNLSVTWGPDGTWLLIRSTRAGAPNVFKIDVGGGGAIERVTTSEFTQVLDSISPDGQWVVVAERHPETARDLWIARLDTDQHEAQPYLETVFGEGAGMVSPTGHYLAYVSDESGRPEIYVQEFPEPGIKWQISSNGGTEPRWAADAGELYFRAGNSMMVVPVSESNGFSADRPTELFEDRFTKSTWMAGYDVTSDGERFLMATRSESDVTTEFRLVENWFSELERLVP